MENMVSANPILTQFEGMKVLVTGHTGFKGSWLSLWLNELGADVSGYALPPENPEQCLYSAAGISQDIASAYGDLRNLNDVIDAVHRCQPEVIFHLGAQSLVRRSYTQPVETYATNVMGAVHVLEAAKSCEALKAVIMVTSDKCYQNNETYRGFKETDAMGGADPYSSSKGCVELVTEAYRRSFFSENRYPHLASARAGNVIGGGDWSEDRLIPDIAKAISSDQPIVVRNPSAIRPWQHVLEPLHGYLILAAKLLNNGAEFAEGWNFGPLRSDTITVGELVARMVKLWGTGRIEHRPDPAAVHEAGLLMLDTEKTGRRLGYAPTLNIDSALQLTADWYQKFLHDPTSAKSLCLEQIHSFMSRLDAPV